MEWVIIGVYAFALLIVCIFSFGQLNLTLHYLRNTRQEDVQADDNTLPFVTIQLPVYNERYVVERLLDGVARLDYPRELFEIQVLDDSTDDTRILVEKQVEYLKKQGLPISVYHRETREGYKAGALKSGLQHARGELIAIFDADFLPRPDFLMRTVPHFKEENIGLVQTRWSHINENYNLLTRMQAFGLNAHFTIEQSGRQAAGSFINFNGTAGIWRKSCIEDAGGWQYDTLTEDLDLSYRAQLKGWKFKYLEQVDSPGELPTFVPAIKSQQYRWNKGAAETARKTIGTLLSAQLPLRHKIRSILHLFGSSVFLFILLAAVLSIPMLIIKDNHPAFQLLFNLGSIFITGFIAITFVYWISVRAIYREESLRYFLVNFPAFMSFTMGLALHNSIAVIEGWLGIKTPFVRTPKFNIKNTADSLRNKFYVRASLQPVTVIEGLLALYFAFGIFQGIRLGDYGLILFHIMLTLGYGYIFLATLRAIIYAR